MKIGFIGTGVMGTSIVEHLLAANYKVCVYNRTKSKAEKLFSLGAEWKENPKAITEETDLIFSMVGYPSDVEEIYFGNDGLFAATIQDKIFVDLTTSTPTLAKKIYAYTQANGAHSLDAPVSGGDLGAKKGTLTIMVGGDSTVYDKVLPLFQTFSSKVNLQGQAGAGQHTKMANQIMIAGTMTGMTELLVYTEKVGLTFDTVLDTVGGGSAENWSLSNYAPRILKNDYSPGFFVKHFIKDLNIALTEAENLQLELPCTQLARDLYQKLAKEGYENLGTQALVKLWWSEETCEKILEEK